MNRGTAPPGHEYEASKMRELRDVSRAMLEIPAVLDAIEARTAVVLTCPKGHKITTVDLDVDPDGRIVLPRVIAEMGRANGSAAVEDLPWRSAKTVCAVPGCPQLVDRLGWCPEHGGRDALAIDHISTRFRCRVGHDWSDRVTTPRLLKVIAAALILGHDRASVTGAGVSRPARSSAVR